MNSRIEHYPAIKPSGVEWLGEVPEHWGVQRLGSSASVLNGATPSTNVKKYWNGDLLWLTPEDLGQLKAQRITSSTRKITLEGHASCGTSIAPANSVALSTRAPIGHLGILATAGCTNQGCKLLIPDASIATLYLYRILETARSELQSLGQGTTFLELSRTRLRNFRLPIPPIEEQTAIARFLDHAINQIERYIRAKEKLIALLEEQKQVMIHDAVTGRIDVRTGKPYPAYKPSGAEWLGNVPALWKVRKLRQCVKIVGGMTPRMEERRFWDGRIPWVTPKDMKREIVSDSSVRVSKAALSDTTLRLINPPVVLMVVRGMILARKIPIAWTSQPVTINQDMKALIPTSDMYAAFLARTLTAAQDTIALWVDVAGHGTRRLPTECWRELIVPIPPIAEQTAILDFIETEITRINDANKCARREIKLLREYRTRLIADVVTGKLDVCEAAANLPKLEAIADGGDETIPAEPDSQQSNITLHNEAPPTTPGASS